MRAPITSFWAKLGRVPAGTAPTEWHPLLDHCADVAATVRILLDQPVIRAWVAALAGLPDLSAVQCDRLALLSALHDVGKVNVGFQNKRLVRPPFTAGHIQPMLDLFGGPGPEGARLAEALELEPLLPWVVGEDAFFELLIAILSHHGRPVLPGSAYEPRLWRAADGLDPFEGAFELRRAAARWFPGAFTGAAPLPAPPALQHGFNGLLTLADWIGSDERFFPFTDAPGRDRFPFSMTRAEDVVRRLGLEAGPTRRALGANVPAFRDIWELPPRDLQSRLQELATSGRGSLTVLEAETGSGKTEAALVRFLGLFHAGAVDGLYFALPTRTAATQIHRRVTEAVKQAFRGADECPAVVLAVPGYLAVDDREFTRLPDFDVLWPEDDRERWRDRGWAAESPKRFLAGSVVVGTIDQVLLSALAVPHSHLRAAALSRHLLVIDEVHASDAYMTHVLEAVLARHVGAGGHALLMSATLGGAARERLLAPGRPGPPPPVGEAVAVPYPLVTHMPRRGAPAERIPLRGGADRRVSVGRALVAGDPDAIAALATEAARRGARVLVIRNTVRECVATQQALERMVGRGAEQPQHVDSAADDGKLLFCCAGVPAPHHARFAREDRQALDAAIEARFGKDAPPTGCVAVATQTVQQSLDLDADLLLTDLCPMDVLLQRIGRLHRHARERPDGFRESRVIMLLPADRDLARLIRAAGDAMGPHGLGTVYPDLRMLEATWQQLESATGLDLPAMNRKLVEATTHPAELQALAEELGAPWTIHHQWVTGTFLAHVRIAGNHLARWDLPFSDPGVRFPDDGIRIGTRLGADDRMVEFDAPLPGPFGQDVRRLIMPHHLARGAPVDACAADIEARDGTLSFRFGARAYVYDRLGLRTSGGATLHEDQDDD